MNKSFSAYLDLARIVAALMVVVDHFVGHHLIAAHAAAFVPALGREAVIIFFVLSGLVIAYVTDQKKQDLKHYAVARAARIYSVALPLLLASFLAVYAVETISGHAVESDYELSKAYFYIPFHSLFLGESWTISEAPLWLESYWSLNYEVWYYIFFGAVFFLRGRLRLVLGAVVFLLMGYKLWLLFPIWLSGVWLWHARARYRFGKRRARLGWLLSVVLFCAYEYCVSDADLRRAGNALWPFAQLPLSSADRFVGDYLVCLIVLFNFYCVLHAGLEFSQRLRANAAALAAYTFPLYLTHGLVIAMWQSFHPAGAGWASMLILMAIIALATLLVGLLTERFRKWLSVVLMRWLNALCALAARGTSAATPRE
jgi:peptidoglycan/LPS O-acetylase OafA/YrhL